MVREFSAGGVVLRRMSGEWHIAAIEPQKEGAGKGTPAAGRRRVARKVLLALPKGLVDEGEKPEETALREVHEETGVTASLISKLADIKYVYVRSWGDGERVFKIVSFYLLRYQSGRIDDVSAEMRVEVRRALWLPLEEASAKLAYGGERQVVRKALEYVKSHPEV
jgi:8-oxo-dGTP pyrophosphatase MutT (NUDIX family)